MRLRCRQWYSRASSLRLSRRLAVRSFRVGVWTFRVRLSSPAISTRSTGTVRAGVCIFPPPGFLAEEPGRQQRQAPVVMPALPRPDLVVGQPRLALGSLQTLLDPVLRLVHPTHLHRRVARYLVAQQVV